MSVETQTQERPMIFHARPTKPKNLVSLAVKKLAAADGCPIAEDKGMPTHTLAFHAECGVLLCTYSKPHPGKEMYSKSKVNYAIDRMTALRRKLDTEGLLDSMVAMAALPRQAYKQNVPSCVRKSLRYYANQARKYFKIENTNPVVIIRGQKADWSTRTWADGTKVPVHAVLFSKKLEEL